MTAPSDTAAHYARDGLVEAIGAALVAAGKDLARLTPQDLAPVDEFHVRGRSATAELAALLDVGPESRIIDIGCGLGGASRHLATTYDCSVAGVDLTAEYIRAATAMAQWLGLEGRVAYRVADALALPFADARFDIAWTQHLQMNIADKPGFYAEAQRVLRPGGMLAFYDVLAGGMAPVHFPVPWARDAAQSHLATPEELRTSLRDAGFDEVHWQDWTAAGRDWFAHMAAARGGTASPLTLRLLLGPKAPAMVANLRRNLEEGRVQLIAGIYRRR